jgi:hypothetical protein
VRWNEPGAFPATDQTSRRARQGRGRRRLRRRVRGECVGRPGAAGSLIPHAGPVGALMVAMIEPAFHALTMAPAGGAGRDLPRGAAAGGRAVGVAAITGRADGKQPVAPSADLLAKRRVHAVGAAARADWTRLENRGTNRPDWLGRVGASRRSPRAWRVKLQAFTSSPSPQPTRPPPRVQTPGGLWTLTRLWTHRPRPQPLGNLAKNARFPQASTARSSLRFQEPIKIDRRSVQISAV